MRLFASSHPLRWCERSEENRCVCIQFYLHTEATIAFSPAVCLSRAHHQLLSCQCLSALYHKKSSSAHTSSMCDMNTIVRGSGEP